MKLKSRNKVDASFNMSSMTDIVFLLLIFFMLTSSTITPMGKKVELPNSNQSQIDSQKLVITITKDLIYQVQGEDVPFEDLYDRLQAKYESPSEDKLDNVIVVHADQGVAYGKVMEAVDIAGQLENVVVLLATKQK